MKLTFPKRHSVKKFALTKPKSAPKSNFMTNLTIAKRISLFAAAIVLAISVLLSFSTIFFSSNVLIKQQEDSAIALAKESAQRIDAIITARLDVLYEVANNENMLTMDFERQRQYLIKQLEKFDYVDMAVVDTSGNGKYILNGEAAQLSDSNYVKEALKGKKSVSEILINKSGIPTIMYAAPIKDKGSVVGALIARRDGTAFNEITDQLGIGESGYAFIFGEDGTIYAHPNREYVRSRANVFKHIEEDGVFKNLGLELQRLGIGNTGIIRYEFEGTRRITAVTPIPNTSWNVGIGAVEKDILKDMVNLRIICMVMGGIALVLGIIAGGFLGRYIASPITKLLATVKKMSEYDFTQSDSKEENHMRKRADEIGKIADAIYIMRDNIASLVRLVVENTELVAASSEELTSITQQSANSANEMAKTIEEFSRGASEQAQSAEIGAQNIHILSDLIGKEQENIKELNASAQLVDRLKNDGLKALNDLIRKTKDNSQAVSDIFKSITETKVSADKIEKGSEMIKTIADQTNLLALNAAIEAARAGDAGRGFAVVADEIRNLADQSNRFADEINIAIQELSHNSDIMVKIMNEVGEIVKAQTESANFTNEKFEGINNAIENMRDVIENLNASSKEMEKKKDEMVNIISELSSVSEEFAAGTQEAAATVEQQTVAIEEIAKSSESLAKLAEQLQLEVSKFKC
ncbi:MAG: methyl-accepting chemotaxis protein [Clostridiaceae bacterium]|nr:methyl-accepting chemotaxis protein [Clostridiaceae bacterium]